MCLFFATTGCLAPQARDANDVDVDAASAEDDDAPEVEAPLTLVLTSLTLRHGSIILTATMEDGSADLSVWLDASTDPSCARREIGRGLATRTGFVWRFDASELARAHACNVVVKAKTTDDDGHRVVRIAPVVVNIDLTSDDDDRASIADQTLAHETRSTRLTFATADRARRLHASGLVVGAEEPSEDDEEEVVVLPSAKPFKAVFDVPNLDLAKAVLSQRPLSVARVRFTASLTIGNVSLDLEAPEDAS